MTARMYGGLQLPAAQQKNLNSKKTVGNGVPEFVPEWVDGQEYLRGEYEPVDTGISLPVEGNQKEEPNQHIIAHN